MVVNLVMQKPMDTMVADLRQGRMISKDQVLRESKSSWPSTHFQYLPDAVRSKAEDPDIVATSTVLSLKDPVAYTRISTPCRSLSCNHNQCFDAAAYLQLQEQAPTWTCPICNKAATWENLALDQYVNDILNSTSPDIEAVTIEPDGRWHIQKESEGTNRKPNPTPSDDDDDDEDLVEIREKPEYRPKVETLTPHSVRTPPMSSREDSTAPSASRSNKRPREDVIDLTLSDEDDAPVPKTQRTSFSTSVPTRTQPPPDRYHFQLPPPGPPPYDFDRFTNSPY